MSGEVLSTYLYHSGSPETRCESQISTPQLVWSDVNLDPWSGVRLSANSIPAAYDVTNTFHMDCQTSKSGIAQRTGYHINKVKYSDNSIKKKQKQKHRILIQYWDSGQN